MEHNLGLPMQLNTVYVLARSLQMGRWMMQQLRDAALYTAELLVRRITISLCLNYSSIPPITNIRAC
jgi:hypothetical protein